MQYNTNEKSNEKQNQIQPPTENEDAEQEERTARKERLLATIKQIQEINPFRNITDAVEWQKQQRDEWE